MLNQFVIIGKLKDITDNTLYIYNNDEIITIIIDNNDMAKNVISYIKNGDSLGVKGKIANNNTLIAERITFLSSNKKED